ncbi:MAG TPA: VWA domain-containing protein [Methylotenera sp.]|nr:VWA domain-containing protein [Methylotenera sp.]HPM49990.1 VWA domain-containing protein [Methylotenera sp.]
MQNGSIWYLLAGLTLLPIWFEPQTQLKSVVQDTLFVIDISESMNVRDVDFPKPQTDRLTLAKLAVREGMASLPCGSKVSVALFAGDESTVLFEPLEVCRHFPAIDQVVSGLDRRMRWIGDSWVTNALTASITEAKKRNLNLVYISDGDEMPARSAPIVTDLAKLRGKIHGLILGVGGDALQPIPRLNQKDEIVGYWTREDAVLEGNHPNLLAQVRALAPGERAPEGTLDEVTEHISSFNKVFMQALSLASGFKLVRINTPKDAVNALNNAEFQKEAMAERDARWIFALIAMGFVVVGWFWQNIQHFLVKRRWLKTKQKV